MKFKFFIPGDRIRTDIGAEATVVSISHIRTGPFTEDAEYGVIWDHWQHKGICTYMGSSIQDMWELIDQIKDAADAGNILGADPGAGYVNQDGNLPVGMYGMLPGEATSKKDCDHKWVEVGFTFTKIVCYHCDKEKPL